LIAYFIGNISSKKYQIAFMYVKVIAKQRWDVFLRHSGCSLFYDCGSVYLNYCMPLLKVENIRSKMKVIS